MNQVFPTRARALPLAGCGLFILSMLCAGDALAQAPPGAGAGFLRAMPPPAGVEIREYRFEPGGQPMKYALFVPRKLDRSKPAPLVVALHGAGGQPQNIMNWLAAAADKHRYILVAPTGYTETGWYGFVRRQAGPAERETSRLSEIDVMNVLGIVRAEFNIDPRRTYLVGSSMGGAGAVHLASKYPEQWAAIGAISPAIVGSLSEELENFAATPVVVLHGDQDATVDVKLVREWVAGMKQRQVPVLYYEFRGGTHISVVQQSGEKVFDFLDQHSRPAGAATP